MKKINYAALERIIAKDQTAIVKPTKDGVIILELHTKKIED